MRVSSCFLVIFRLSVKEDRPVGTRRPKKDTNEVKDPSSVTEKRSPAEPSPTTTSSASSSVNNNVNKHLNAATARQDTSNRSKSAKTETVKNANEPSDRRGRTGSTSSDSLDNVRRSSPVTKERKAKSSQENRVKSMPETSVSQANTVRKPPDGKKMEAKATELKETKITEDRISPSSAAVTEAVVDGPCSARFEGSNKKENRETKGKLKKKSKAAARKEEKEQKQLLRVKGNTKQQLQRQQQIEREEETTLSDGSASDDSSEKSLPEVKIQKPVSENKRSRAEKEPVSKAATHEPQENGKAKNRKNHNTTNAKKQATETQPTATRPKILEVASGKSKTATNDSPDEVRGFGATSPHAIAAAVISLSLEKSMQTCGRENNFDEQEGSKKKAYTKNVAALTPTLSDSTPPMSPTNLSGSSRSSSYSSIVSSDGSPASEQNRLANGKSGKAKVKATSSVPLAGRSSQSPFSLGNGDSQTIGVFPLFCVQCVAAILLQFIFSVFSYLILA